MFGRILEKSFSGRKSRVAIAVVAIVMGASVASALLTTSIGMKEQIGNEFRRFGANIIVFPRSETIEIGLPGMPFGSVTEQSYINESDLWKIKKIAKWSDNVLGYAPFLYQMVEADISGQDEGKAVVLVGTYFEHREPLVKDSLGNPWITGIKKIAPYWRIDGDWISNENDTKGSLVGVEAADKLGLGLWDSYSVSYTHPDTKNLISWDLVVTGILSTGGIEDSQIFVNLGTAQAISMRENKVHTVQVSGLCLDCPAEEIAKEIERNLPEVEAKTVRRLVNAEEEIMMRVEKMMALVTVVSLAASALGVMTTMTTTVIERRKEIGLMKAVGAESKMIASLFLAEAGIIGLLGGIIGYIVGYFLAQFIVQSVFSSSVSVVLEVIPITIFLSVAVAVLSGAVPIRRALKIEPAIVLRGD